MCGIVAIINKDNSKSATSLDLIKACKIIDHRGPDDEGFLTWDMKAEPRIWFGGDTAPTTRLHWQLQQLEDNINYAVGLGHRRLSIVDLSPAGYQPMMFGEAGLSIVFNGEIYNYLEIRDELQTLGHSFVSKTDTEVILHAWHEWGKGCLDKFNGMFAFILLDQNNKKIFAVRDRFGVKPLYYYATSETVIFASEIKQIRSYRYFNLGVNEQLLVEYLATGSVDHTNKTFDTQISQVPAGHYLEVDLSDTKPLKSTQWYELKPISWKGSWADAVENLKAILTDAVRLRLRSDVTVGSCLSGGLDSSSIVCIAAELLKTSGDFAGQETVTACYEDQRYDEWNFAEEVIKYSGAHPHQVFPTFNDLKKDIDLFLWHQDDPTGSTSQFSQWSVFKKTHEIGLKVMIDGQGADEQLAGYGGNDLPFYTGLLKGAKFGALLDEARYYKMEKGTWPVGFLLGAFQLSMGTAVTSMFPKRLQANGVTGQNWINDAKQYMHSVLPARSLRENLLRQVHGEPLPALLRYEDRNSMAWSVESRTPFMDYRLLEFTLGLPERFVYYRGTRKHILRNAMKDIIPEKISNRRDKMGFVTPEEQWIRQEDSEWFKKGIEQALDIFPHIFNKDETIKNLRQTIDGTRPFDFSIWRIVCLGKWSSVLNKFK